MKWLDSLTLAAQRCTSRRLRTNGLTFLLFLLSHVMSIFSHNLCNQKRTGRSSSPTRHQLLSDRLRSGQIFPSDIAVPPGPGGRYRSMNTTFQRSNEQAPVYELPPIHTLATTVQENISNMNVQSSPGFDPFSTSFIKHADKTIQDDRGKRHTEIVLLLLLTCSICSCQTVSPHVFGTKPKLRLCTKKVKLCPQKLSFAGYQ